MGEGFRFFQFRAPVEDVDVAGECIQFVADSSGTRVGQQPRPEKCIQNMTRSQQGKDFFLAWVRRRDKET